MNQNNIPRRHPYLRIRHCKAKQANKVSRTSGCIMSYFTTYIGTSWDYRPTSSRLSWFKPPDMTILISCERDSLLEEDNTMNTMVTRPSTLSILRFSLLVLHDYILEEQHHKYNGDASFHPFYSHTLIPFILHKLCGCGMMQSPRTLSYINHPLAAISSVNCT